MQPVSIGDQLDIDNPFILEREAERDTHLSTRSPGCRGGARGLQAAGKLWEGVQ